MRQTSYRGFSRKKKNEKKLARSFNFSFRYTYDVLLLINCSFGDFVDPIYPIELEIKETTNTDRFASYLDVHLEIDNEVNNMRLIYKSLAVFLLTNKL
jgi:hypothetical protein